ncbi:hypothetical protein EXN66_Car014538 [Channa argus]|uniref:Uncharacterized protein n=1 Tax=Channa argus TaxID=215402 RepID=A0A6G1Q899_CHAAH|nr:hypothetical protein EXN66_Car014538 [Channa argus]
MDAWKTPAICAGYGIIIFMFSGKPIRDHALISALLLVGGFSHTEELESNVSPSIVNKL